MIRNMQKPNLVQIAKGSKRYSITINCHMNKNNVPKHVLDVPIVSQKHLVKLGIINAETNHKTDNFNIDSIF